MTKREVVQLALAAQRPPYVPWSFSFTHEAAAKLRQHFGVTDHRINLTIQNLPAILAGDLDELLAALLADDLRQRLGQVAG